MVSRLMKMKEKIISWTHLLTAFTSHITEEIEKNTKKKRERRKNKTDIPLNFEFFILEKKTLDRALERVSSYSTRASHSLTRSRFSPRYMKDSVAHSGSTLWNSVTYKHNGLVNRTRYSDLRWSQYRYLILRWYLHPLVVLDLNSLYILDF